MNIKAITSCLGYQQITSLSSATGLTVPTRDPSTGANVKANFALITAEAQNLRWRDDGVDPTSSVGMPLAAGVTLQYDGDLSRIKFIQQTSGGIVNISYYV
jgi:hypothetical protein